MRKILLSAALCAFLSVSASCGEAAFVPSHGAGAGGVVSAEAAKELPDDVKVVLRGNIVKHIRRDYYEFRDESGSLTVEIDDDIWRGLIVSPEDRVEIRGEVDRDFNSMKIEADYIEILKTP